jgi:hypothetical protein
MSQNNGPFRFVWPISIPSRSLSRELPNGAMISFGMHRAIMQEIERDHHNHFQESEGMQPRGQLVVGRRK